MASTLFEFGEPLYEATLRFTKVTEYGLTARGRKLRFHGR